MVTCPKCGYDNELGRIFCHSCGTKLNLQEIKSTNEGGRALKKKKGRSPIGRLVRGTINVAIPVALIVTVYLAVQVPGIRPISTTNEPAMSPPKCSAFELSAALP